MKKYFFTSIILAVTINASFSQIRARNNGYVGIGGTSAPIEAFQIGDRFTFSNGGTKVIGYNVYNDIIDKRIVAEKSASFRMDPSGISLCVANTGNVASSISWNSALQILNNGASSPTIKINGTTWIGSYYFSSGSWIYSDERLKENIKPITNATNLLMGLNGKIYNLKSGNFKSAEISKRNSFGLIAQEVQKIIPELVIESHDSLNSLAVNYDGLIPILIEAIKEQKLKTDSLQKEITDIKSSNAVLSTNNSVVSSTAKIFQNNPNPFNKDTQIRYFIPSDALQSAIYVYDMQGLQLKKISIGTYGNGRITLNSYEFRPGMYLYTLIIDGKEIDTKRMIMTE